LSLTGAALREASKSWSRRSVFRSAGWSVEQAEGAHAVQTAQRHVVQEAAQKLVGVPSHGPALAVVAVSVVEGDGAVVAGGDGLVGKRGAM